MPSTVTILDGPLPPMQPTAPPEGAGAWLLFEGIVRPIEAGQQIDALDYQTYEPMAQSTITRIAEELISKHALLALHVWHSRGRVPVGACSFRLLIAAPHRKEALHAIDEFIDRLKQDAPIWKTAPRAAAR